MRNIIIHHRSKHHAENSGYGKLADYLDGETLPYLKSKFPYRIAKMLARWVSNKKGNYETMSLIKDYELCKRILFSNDKGVVHYLNGERDIRFGIQLNKFKKNYKFIATFHKPPEVLKNNFNSSVFKKLDGAIAVGENQVAFLKEWLQTDNVVYIPHGIDTDFFVPDETIKEPNTILFVGQHLRDFEAFNYAVPRLAALIPNLKVNVILRKDFSKKIHSNPCVTIHSGIDDEHLRTFYQKATLLFLPLKNSTACNSILEAMSCGLPVISTYVGGTKEYVKESGRLVSYGNNEELIEITQTLLNDTMQLEALGKEARTNALQYDWKLIAKKVELFYMGF